MYIWFYRKFQEADFRAGNAAQRLREMGLRVDQSLFCSSKRRSVRIAGKSALTRSDPKSLTSDEIIGDTASKAAFLAILPDGLSATSLRRASSQSGLMWTYPAISSFARVFVIAPRVTWKLLASCAGVLSAPILANWFNTAKWDNSMPLGKTLAKLLRKSWSTVKTSLNREIARLFGSSDM